MKRILTFGDSNTWGYISGTFDRRTLYCERYSASIRWTGRLQHHFRDNYIVIEEGMPGRTIATDDPLFPGVNGSTYFMPCLLSQSPLDLIIIMLGTNDLKCAYGLNAKQIALHMESLCSVAEKNFLGADFIAPSIMIVAPPIIHTDKLNDDLKPFYSGSDLESAKLAASYQKIANKHDYYFYDASYLTLSSESDGLHFDSSTHIEFAAALSTEIKVILKRRSKQYENCING